MTLENIMTSVRDRIDDITSHNPNPACLGVPELSAVLKLQAVSHLCRRRDGRHTTYLSTSTTPNLTPLTLFTTDVLSPPFP